MSLKHGLLGLLNYGPMTGYELDKAFKASLNFFWQAQPSQIYRELKDMEKQGWLTSQIEFQTDKPNKKLYSLTDAGKQELLAWLAKSPPEASQRIRSEFLLKLFFSGERSAQDSIAMLKAYRAECERELDRLSQIDDNIELYDKTIINHDHQKTVYWNLTAQFGKAYIHMCLTFADQSIQQLEALP